MKKLTKALSFLLTLAMVVGLMPGMSLTAYAAPSGSSLDNPFDSGETVGYASLVNTTTVVNFDGKDWYLIEDNSTAANAGTVTLLLKECVDASEYDSTNSSSTYSGSTVETAVNNYYTNSISSNVKSAIVDSKMFLLTTDQANAMTENTRKCSEASGAEYNYWWLCSPGHDDNYAAYVNGGTGRVIGGGSLVNNTLGVRPALKLDLSKVTFDSDTKTFALTAASPAHTHDGITFTAWTSADSLPTEAGSYYLTKDVTIGSTWSVPAGETNLCLNGHKITLITKADYAVSVGQGATLNLYDDEEESGAIVLASESESDSSYVGVYVREGTFRLYGGTIRSFFKGVYLDGTNSTFTMTGGTIQNCEVCGVEADGTVTLTGGVITGNRRGVTVSEDNVVFLSGAPTISGNGSEEKKENLMLYGGTVQVVGELTNTTPIGVGIEKSVSMFETVYTGVFTTGSTENLKASDYADKFVSDNSAYAVLTEGKELKLAQAPVPYMAWDETSKTVKNVEGGCTSYTVVTDSTTAWEEGKWYVVNSDVTIDNSRITVSGTANLILCDGATLTASKGITVNSGNTINIYAQSEGTGVLSAGNTANAAGIGGGGRGSSSGTVNIHGGKISATGGSTSAGIGGALEGGNGEVNIYSGEVTAQGQNFAAGIGGYSGKSGGTVNIYGGTVNASGKSYGTPGIGIGGTEPGSCVVHIYGGEVTATSEKAAAGIQGTVTIDGGTVTANGGGDSNSLDCNSGETYSSNGINGTVTINGGTVTATGGNVTVTGFMSAIESSRGGTIYACSGISGTVTISGGTVRATGGNVTGEISNRGGNIYACNGIGGTVTISGGMVTATGGSHTGNSSGTTVKEKGFGGSLTIGDSVKVFGGDSADPTTEIEKSNDDYTRFRYMIVKLGHAHSFTYSATGATITATCSADGCTLTDSKATLTIVAPTLTTYGGTGNAAATLTGLDDFNTATGKTIAATDIEYVGRDGTSYDESTTAPTGAGKYTAKITVEGETAAVNYEIAKASIGTPTVTMAGYTYGGMVSTPGIEAYSGEGAVTYYYNTANSTTGGTEWKDITATTLAAGTYYMYAVIAEAENYSGYTTATTSFTVAAPYSLYLGGTQVTSANAADVFGDGKASYNAESNTLTLNGYSNGEKFYKEAEAGAYNAEYRIAAGVYYAGAEKLTVALEGNNVLTMPEFSEDKLDNAAFFSKGSVEFTGTGSLTATGGKASDSSEDSNVGSYGLCAIGENAAFMGSGAVTFTAGSGESSYGAYFGKETAVAFSGGTVTMTGGTSTGGSYGMYCGRVEVTGGEVQVTGGEAGIFSFGIYCWRDISVTGGSLTATGGSAANSSYGIRGIRETRCDIVVSGGTLNAVGGSASKESCGIYSDWGGVNVSGGGAVNAEGGTVTGDSGRSCGISNSMHSISVKNGTLTATGGSVTGSGGKSIGLYSSVGPIYFEEGASVSCLGGTVTGENGESFGVSGFGSYIMGGVITATGGNAAYSCGYYDKMALLVDAGTLTATGGEGSRSHGIFNRDYIELNGGAVTAVGGSGSAESCGVYLAARQLSDETYKASTLTITGGEVSATGGSCGVFCDPATDGKVIVIAGGVTTVAGNTAISRAPILGADVRASGSTSMDGSSPAEYSEASNDTYKWFKTETVAGEKTPITTVAFTVEEPVVGAEPAEWVEITTEPEGALTTTAYRAVWVEVDEDYNYVPMTSKLFETGKKYAVLEPNEESAGAPLVALCASGYVLPTDEEPVYTINGEETLLLGYFGPYTPIEGAEFSVSVSPAELRFSAYTGYSEEDPSLYREVTASNTGNGKVRFITAGFTESSMYEQFGLIVGGMTATVYPKEGLTQGTYTATVRIEDFYDRFDTIEVPVTFTVYTRSTASSTPAVETVTVPVSGEDEKVDVTVKVSGDTATITSADVDKVLNAEEVGTVTVDVSALKNGVSEVVIPGAMVEKIADAVADESNTADGLEIKLPTGTITFDAEAVAAISEQADGKDLHLNLEDIGENKLNTAQKDTVKDMDVQGVLDAYMTSNGKRISDFKGGKATVTVSYELKDGQVGRGIVVWYVSDNGEKTEVPAAYSNKEISFTVEHFSNYVIAYDAERAASCPKDDTCPISEFTDADANAWYHDGVHFVLENKLMSGYGDGKFGPADYTSRAMVAQILWNLEGKPASTYEMDYTDVAGDAWYADAIRWASEKGVVTGYGDGKFGPDDNITREQLAAIIYRYAQSKGQGFTGMWMFNLDYEDAASVSDWASEAMHWMVMKGIIKGQTDKTLAPKSFASRAEIATMIMRYAALEK
ncbi:MAG: S-layer homology domain-containing protein [Oscillospiraceae bacterium]|nr:S-layer homology domain-containing protein [Oscillospiraceae bacterium]